MTLARWHERFQGKLAGSVYAAAPPDRVDTAIALARAGLDVHVDLIGDANDAHVGVGLADLRAMAAHVERDRIGVHLIGSSGYVASVLEAVLELRPAVVFLPWASFTFESSAAIRTAGGSPWITLWDEWDGTGSPLWEGDPDGVLVMLIEPGTTGTARLDRLGLVSACAAVKPVAVDGGVNHDLSPHCLQAGAQNLVVGRALLNPEGTTP